MSVRNGGKHLEFACECFSSRGGYSDPWAMVAQKKFLPDGTKEEILCSLADSPKTIAQLAKELRLSSPSVFTHITEMSASELLRETPSGAKRYPVERFYEPNFPVVSREERAEFDELCEEMSAQLAAAFARRRKKLEAAFGRTKLAERGWKFEDVAQYLFTRVQRGARRTLEEQGQLPVRCKRRNGCQWLFWAEEAEENAE